MKIGIVTPYHENFGGGEVFIESLNNYINQSTIFDSAIFTSDKGVFTSEVVPIPQIGNYKNLVRNIYQVVKILKEQEVDVVIINDVFLATFCSIFRLLGFEIVSLLHLELSNVKCKKKFLAKIVINARKHLISLGSNKIFTVNKTNLKYFQEKTKYIGNFVDFEHFSHYHRDREHSEYDFIYVGRLVEVKNVRKVVSVFNEYVSKFNKSSKLLIVGEGPQKKEIDELINTFSLHDNVKMQGFVPRSKIKEHYLNAKVCILLSRSEGFPTVLLEAMATGMPCISTNVGSCSEIVDNKTGYIVDLESNSKIAEAMHDLIINFDEFSLRAQQKSKAYSSEVVLKKIVGELI